MNALDSSIDEGMERGDNPRILEREQVVRLMSLIADVFFIGSWDPEKGGHKLENQLQKGVAIPERHLRAWRIAREEILANVLKWVRLVIENYYAFAGQPIDRDRLFHRPFPEALWQRVETFLRHSAELPCWVDKNLSSTVFGAKQNRDFWKKVFETGKTPSGVRVLAQPLELMRMIQQGPMKGDAA